jgi:lipopolysaccharide transport system ATP-binding protein
MEDISFDVYQKEPRDLIGQNGAGKTTTLGLIAGVLNRRGKVS